MNELSEYEIQRLKNIEYNKSVLRSLEIPGLVSDLVYTLRKFYEYLTYLL